MKTFTKQMLQILVLIAAMLACVLNLQAQNMSRYITMTVQNGQLIRFGMKAEAAGTLVRVISGANDTTITVGTDWTGFSNYYTAAAGTMTVYGNITGFDCSGNSTKLTAIDVTNNTALKYLGCRGNQLTTLDVTNNTALTYLDCGENQLTAIDVTNNTALIELNCSGNPLTTLNVSNNTALTELGCHDNQLTTLDVTNNTALTWLSCGENQLTTLDVTNNTALTVLYCGGNQLTTLDVTNNTALTRFECDGNQLTTLVVTNNTALTKLECSNNQLTTLDVTNNTALTKLECSNNQLTTLVVTNNTALGGLYCFGNQLTTLDVSNNTALEALYCFGNQLDACALDQMFRTLPERQASDNAKVVIKNEDETNPGADGCRTPIANAKNWKVMDWNNDNPMEINNTTFTCQEVNIDNILTAHEIKLYPNPVNSELYIATDAEVRIIQVFNMNGVEVARKFESNRIDLNHLQPNTYIVRITTDRNSSNQFVIKQ